MEINLIKVTGIEEWCTNLENFQKKLSVLGKTLKKDGNFRKYNKNTFILIERYSLSDDFYGFSLDLFKSEIKEEHQKNMILMALGFSACELIKKKYPSLYNDKLEKNLKKSSSIEELLYKINKNCGNIAIETNPFFQDLIKLRDKFFTQNFEKLFLEYMATILLPKPKNYLPKSILIDIPDKYIKQELKSTLEEIKLLYKLEISFFNQNSMYSNFFDLKKSFENKKELFLSKIDLKKYLDKDFFKIEIVKNQKNNDILKHIFNENVSKVKVNKLLKEMKLIETILEISIFEWNIIEELDYKVFYNLFNFIYSNSSPSFPLQSFDQDSITTGNEIQFLISTLLHTKSKESLYLEGNLSWIKDIPFIEFSLIDDFNETLKELEKSGNEKEVEIMTNSLLEKSAINLKTKNFKELLEKTEKSFYLALNINPIKNIVSKKINSSGFPLGAFGIENELDFELENYDKVFIAFNKENLHLLAEKTNFISQNGVGVFAVPESFFKDDSYKEIRNKMSLEKRIKSIIRLDKINSESYFKSVENYYLILIKKKSDKIILADQISLYTEIQSIKVISYRKITDLVEDSNFDYSFTTIDSHEIIDIDLEATPFSIESNEFLGDILKELEELNKIVV
ncbi:MAG: hypothetical protein ACRC0Y_07640 [Fusobacteriaceae bacterium]